METPEANSSATIISDQITRDYKIVRCLGRGGMGHVYLAEQLRVGRRLVALKVLNRACADNPQVIKRFEAEAATAGLIHHRNVVTIYESRVTDDGQIYVAMEYVHGPTLRAVLDERKCLPLTEVVEITKQVCGGLQAAHKLGIVHRDIKPDNIMLAHDDDGLTVKVLDFGIARLSEAQASTMHTAPGLVLGTPVYMSPEQAAGQIGEQIDARSDIYSLGMVVYEMLVGRTPFTGATYPAILYQHLYETPPPPSTCAEAGNITPAIDEVLMSALAKDRNRRPARVMDFAHALEAACVQDCIGPTDLLPSQQATKPARPLNSSAPSVTPARRRNLALTAVALIFVAVSLTAAWYFRQGPSPAPPAATTVRQAALDYRLLHRASNGEPEPLPVDHTAPSAARLLFEFQLPQPARLYFFDERADGSWLWLDATEDGQAPLQPAASKVEVPRDNWYVLDDRVGEERFWIVLVPEGVTWSVTDFTAQPRIALNSAEELAGSGTLAPATVAKLRAWLAEHGNHLTADPPPTALAPTRLWQTAAPPRVAYYQIKLNHIAKE